MKDRHYRCIFCTQPAQPFAVTAPVHSCEPLPALAAPRGAGLSFAGMQGSAREGGRGGQLRPTPLGMPVWGGRGLTPALPPRSPALPTPCALFCFCGGSQGDPPSMFVVINPWSSHASSRFVGGGIQFRGAAGLGMRAGVTGGAGELRGGAAIGRLLPGVLFGASFDLIGGGGRQP